MIADDKYFKALKVFRLGLSLSGALIAAYNLFSGGLGLDPSHFFIPSVRSSSRGHSLRVLQGSAGS